MIKTFYPDNTLKNNDEVENKSLLHFLTKQKQIINDIIKNCYKNLENLSK